MMIIGRPSEQLKSGIGYLHFTRGTSIHRNKLYIALFKPEKEGDGLAIRREAPTASMWTGLRKIRSPALKGIEKGKHLLAIFGL